MEDEALYELITQAIEQVLDDRDGGGNIAIARRMIGGRVIFEDDQGREARVVAAEALFKKVTSVREKLRVLEQKLNNHNTLDLADKAEFQALITRCYGSLTTFNFLFEDDADRFSGTGG